MSTFKGENIAYGEVSCDVKVMDSNYEKYMELMQQINKLRKYSLADTIVPPIAREAVANFNDALFTYCKARNDADIDLTASDGVSILYTFLHNNFYDDFHIAYHETWLSLIAGNKKSSDSKWVSRFKDIKLLDNQIIYLICSNKRGSNPLRSFIGDIVLSYYGEKTDFDDNLKNAFDKYVSVLLKDTYNLTSDGIYNLPKLTMLLDDLLSDKHFNANSGGGCTKLQANTICSRITFDINNISHDIYTKDKMQCRGRSTTLRTPLLKLINFVLDTTNLVLSDLFSNDDNVTIYIGEENRELAYAMSKGVELSCSVIEQVVDGVTHFILPHPGMPVQSCRLMDTLFKALGATNVTLYFKED